jgi:hypothetical protein
MAVQFASWIMNPVHDWLEEQVKKAVKWIGAEAEKSPPAIIWLSQL